MWDIRRRGQISKCVHSSRESDIFQDICKVKEDTWHWHRLIKVVQDVTYKTKSPPTNYYPVHFGHMDPSYSTKTGAIAVKLFLSSAKNRANLSKKKKKAC